MKNREGSLEITALALHLLAMFCMLLDHLWATVIPGQNWMTCVGRLAYPIFAFLIVEGYFHTGSLRRYAGRLLLFAVLSEIPFNLMYSGRFLYPFHQNVLWTFLLALGCIRVVDRVRQKGKLWLTAITVFVTALLGWLLGMITMVDYNGPGVLMVLVFYLFHGRKWWCFLGQVAALWWINVELLGGLSYPVELFGQTIELVQQGLALLALVPIWLYRGKQGPSNRLIRYGCYGFYPLHMMLLGLMVMR